MINPLPYFLDSLNITGVGDIPRLYTVIPLSKSEATARFVTISPDGLVSLPTTHFFDFIRGEKFLQK